MTVQLRSLRVSAEMDASKFTQAAQQIAASSAQASLGAKALGAALAQTDAAATQSGVGADKAAAAAARLSAKLVDGYKATDAFNKQIREIGRAMDAGLGSDRAGILLDSLYRKTGQVADAMLLAKQGFTAIAPVVDQLNAHYARQTAQADALAAAQTRMAQASRSATVAQEAQASINQRLGVGGTSATSGGATFGELEKLSIRLEQERAARLAAQNASVAAAINGSVGMGSSAVGGGATFSALEAREKERLKVEFAEIEAAYQAHVDKVTRLEAGRRKAILAEGFNTGEGNRKAVEAQFKDLEQALQTYQARGARLEGGRKTAVLNEGFARGEENRRAAEAEDRLAESLKKRVVTQAGVNAEIKSYNDLQAKGKLTTEEVNLLTVNATKRLTDYQHQMSGVGGTGRRVSNEMANLSFQLNDVVTGLALGQSPFMIMAQQGGQVLQILQTGQGGISGTLKNVGATLAGLVTPTTLFVGSLAAIGATAIYAADRWDTAQRELSRSLTGLGRDSGLTKDRLNEMADAAARAQGISTSQTRDTAGALAQTGRRSTTTQRFMNIQRDLQATLALDATEANQLLAQSFADPVKGAELLNDRLGGLTERTRAYIRSAVASGDEDKARTALLDTFIPRLGRAADLTSFWARTWESVKSGASLALDAVGRTIDGATTKLESTAESRAQERIRALEAQVRGAPTAGDLTQSNVAFWQRPFQGFSGPNVEDERRKREEINQQIERERQNLDSIRMAQERVNEMVAIETGARATRADQERRMAAGTTAAREQGIPEQAQSDALRKLILDYERLRGLRETAYQLQGEEGGGARYQQAVENQRAAERALREQLQNNGRGVFDQRDSTRPLMLDTEAILQRRLSLQEQLNQRTNVERQGITAVTAAQQGAATAEQIRQQARERGASAGQQELVNAQAQAAAGTTLLRINHQLTEAGRERIRSANDNVATARAETAAMGESVGVQERVRMEQQLLTDAKREYRRLGLTIPDAEVQALRAAADEMGKVRQAQAELRMQRDASFEREQMYRTDIEKTVASQMRSLYGDNYASYMDSAIASTIRLNEQLKVTQSLTGDAVKGFTSDVLNGRNVFDAAANAAKRLSDRLVSMALDALIQQLFKQLMGSGGGLLGGFFGGGGGGAVISPFSGYEAGGYTGSGGRYEPAGVVHKNEYVFSSPAVNRIGLGRLETLHRGYADGGLVGGPSNDNRASGGRPVNVVVNAPPGSEVEQTTDSQGNVQIDIFKAAEGQMASNVASGRGSLVKAMSARLASPQKGALRG